MTAPPPLTGVEDRGVLRFITAGSVDDGKSTLIGRLLYDTKSILSDQLTALARPASAAPPAAPSLTCRCSPTAWKPSASRASPSTWRTATSPPRRRKFIIADTPGHEQYTRNMVTGASTADAAVILIDATRVIDGALLPQTRRHSALPGCSAFGTSWSPSTSSTSSASRRRSSTPSSAPTARWPTGSAWPT